VGRLCIAARRSTARAASLPSGVLQVIPLPSGVRLMTSRQCGCMASESVPEQSRRPDEGPKYVVATRNMLFELQVHQPVERICHSLLLHAVQHGRPHRGVSLPQPDTGTSAVGRSLAHAAALALSFGLDAERMFARAASALLVSGGGPGAELLLRRAVEAGHLDGETSVVVAFADELMLQLGCKLRRPRSWRTRTPTALDELSPPSPESCSCAMRDAIASLVRPLFAALRALQTSLWADTFTAEVVAQPLLRQPTSATTLQECVLSAAGRLAMALLCCLLHVSLQTQQRDVPTATPAARAMAVSATAMAPGDRKPAELAAGEGGIEAGEANGLIWELVRSDLGKVAPLELGRVLAACGRWQELLELLPPDDALRLLCRHHSLEAGTTQDPLAQLPPPVAPLPPATWARLLDAAGADGGGPECAKGRMLLRLCLLPTEQDCTADTARRSAASSADGAETRSAQLQVFLRHWLALGWPLDALRAELTAALPLAAPALLWLMHHRPTLLADVSLGPHVLLAAIARATPATRERTSLPVAAERVVCALAARWAPACVRGR